MLRIAPCRERIRRILRKNVHPWHGYVSFQRELLYQAVKLRVVIRADFLAAVHLDNDFIAEPVTEEIHAAGKDQGHERALTAAEEISCPDQQRREHCKQNRGAKTIH